jgi:hypothetical protein
MSENLGVGLYYIYVEKNGKQAGQVVQVTDYNGYVIGDLNQLVVWLQSSKDTTLDGEVSYNQKVIGKTSVKGLGTFPISLPQNALLMAIFSDLNQEVYAKEIYTRLNELVIKGHTTISESYYYLTHLPTNLLVSTFELDLKGKKEVIALDYDSFYHLDFSAQEAENLKFKAMVGTVEVTTNYIGTYKDITTSLDFDYRTELVGLSEGTKVGELVTVKHYITSRLPLSHFRIKEVLPAGLVYIGNVEVTSKDVEIFAYDYIGGKEVELFTYAYQTNQQSAGYTFTLTYQARAAAVGQYGFEPSILVSGNAYQVSDQEVTTIEILK